MTPGLAYALGAMFFFGLADFVYQRAAAAGAPAAHFLMVQAWCFAPGIWLFGLASGTLALGEPMLWGMGAGALIYFALYHFARSLEGGAVSVNAPIFRLSFVVTAVLAVAFLGEPLGALKLAGLGAALAAVWLLLGERAPRDGAAPRLRGAVAARVAAATVAMGVVNLFYKLGVAAGGSPATVLAGQASVFVVLATACGWARGRSLRAHAAARSHAPLAALLLLFAAVLLLAGLARGAASVLVPIAQMSFVVTAALGIALLGERRSGRKAAGIACAGAALALLAQS